MKSIVFIPPNGEIVGQDFALYRIIKYFSKIGFGTTLLIVNDISQFLNYDAHIVKLENQNSILQHLQETKYDLIFVRSWMHRYLFAATLAQKFDNVVSYIKDWHDFPREKYQFVFDTVEDVDAIATIFKHSKVILSHYSSKYTDILALRYRVNKNKFYFFPEYSEVSNYNPISEKIYDLENIRLLMAGGGTNTGAPNIIVPGKSFFDALIQISNNNIYVEMIVIQKTYDMIYQNKKMYLDYLYENEFNQYFSIKKGEDLKSSIGAKYHFGLFGDTNFPKDALYLEAEMYGVTSKFAFYLECGLPVLVNKRFRTLSNIVEKNKIGLTFVDDDLKDFKKILDITQNKYNQLLQNVYKFREIFTYNEETMKPILDLLRQ